MTTDDARAALLEAAAGIARDLGKRLAELAEALAEEKAEREEKAAAAAAAAPKAAAKEEDKKEAQPLPTLAALFYGEKPEFEERFATAAAEAGRAVPPLDALKLIAEANALVASESAAAGLEPPCDFEEAGWCALLNDASTPEARAALMDAFEAYALEEEAAGEKRRGLLARSFVFFEFGGISERDENERVIAFIDRSAPLLEGRWADEAQKRRSFLAAAVAHLDGRL